MSRKRQILLLFASLVAMTVFAASPTSENPGSAASLDDYRVLWERNIFVRNRSRRRKPRPVATRPVVAVVVDTDERFVLTGAVQMGRVWVAFIEDTSSGETIRARAGDSTGSGKLVKITLDYVDYERNGSTVRIEVGGTLAGTTPSHLPAGRAASGNSSSTDAGKPAGTAEAAILERMRKRRERENSK